MKTLENLKTIHGDRFVLKCDPTLVVEWDAETSRQHGWGIGLTTVRGVAEAHGGSVRVESSHETGTSFILEIPVAAHSQTALEKTPAQSTKPSSADLTL